MNPPPSTAAASTARGATSLVRAAEPAPRIRASLASRVASLVYGVIAYVLFLGTFLYAIGFVSGLVVPVTADGGRSAPIAEALLVNGGFLALFAVQHTIMARRWFKAWWTRIVPRHLERSTFVIATCAILVPMYWQWRHIPGELWSVEGPAALVLRAVSFLGWGTVLFSSFLIDHFDLFGLRQTVRHFLGLPHAGPVFRERALYRHVRHPLMLGFLLAFWATPTMTFGHLFFAAMASAYILVGVQIEERTLVAEHGEDYREYQRRVPMLIPTGRRG